MILNFHSPKSFWDWWPVQESNFTSYGWKDLNSLHTWEVQKAKVVETERFELILVPNNAYTVHESLQCRPDLNTISSASQRAAQLVPWDFEKAPAAASRVLPPLTIFYTQPTPSLLARRARYSRRRPGRWTRCPWAPGAAAPPIQWRKGSWTLVLSVTSDWGYFTDWVVLRSKYMFCMKYAVHSCAQYIQTNFKFTSSVYGEISYKVAVCTFSGYTLEIVKKIPSKYLIVWNRCIVHCQFCASSPSPLFDKDCVPASAHSMSFTWIYWFLFKLACIICFIRGKRSRWRYVLLLKKRQWSVSRCMEHTKTQPKPQHLFCCCREPPAAPAAVHDLLSDPY